MFDRRSCNGVAAGSQASVAGFTLLELMIVVTILGIVATIGVPQYVSALRVARIGKSKHDLMTISREIDAYAARNEGHWPLTLHQVGFGGRLDPWGVPYCYLNYADGTGDGLQWAIAAGLVDPAAFIGQGPRVRAHGPGLLASAPARFGLPRDASAPQGPIPIIPPVVAPIVAPVVEAAEEIAVSITTRLERELSIVESESLTVATSSSGFSMFTGVSTETTRRRDRYMFPLNTDYDLFSLGPDGRTSVSLGESVGLDDVIRANNGGFFGSASEY